MSFPKKLGFLLSPRFWAMVLGIAAAYLDQTLTATQALQAFAAGFLTVGTADRAIDKITAPKTNNLTNTPV